MPKTQSVWECQQCGSQSPKWSGKCPDCGQWNTLVETVASATEGRRTKAEGRRRTSAEQAKPQKLSDILKDIDPKTHRIGTGIGELDRVLGGGLVPGQVVLLAGEPGMGKSTLLSQVALQLSNSFQNTLKTLNAGKSEKSENQKTGTSGIPILRQSDISGSPSFPSVPNILYVCGEESPSQVGLRLRRLSMVTMAETAKMAKNHSSHFDHFDHFDHLSLLPETDVDAVVAQIEKQFGYQPSVVSSRLQVNRFSVNRSETDKPKTDKLGTENRKQRTDNGIVIIDSIQTMATADLSGLSGSVGQIRESTGRLSQVAKQLNIPIFLVGHVTKEGEVAGPKVLEHMVDTVLVMEGDRSGNLRILRSLKNRFGPVDEVGIFSMDDGGMREVKNPAELLVGDLAGHAPGSVLGCILEGQRPLVLEIQALAVSTKLSFPRRVGQGISERRLQLLCAVIEKHLGLGIGEKDVFVNIAGGLKTSDPGLDLPVVAAIISSASFPSSRAVSPVVIPSVAEGSSRRRSGSAAAGGLDPSTPSLSSVAQDDRKAVIFSGEVGLLGEVRMVPGWPRREKEVGRLGLGKLVGKPEIKHISELRKLLG